MQVTPSANLAMVALIIAATQCSKVYLRSDGCIRVVDREDENQDGFQPEREKLLGIAGRVGQRVVIAPAYDAPDVVRILNASALTMYGPLKGAN